MECSYCKLEAKPDAMFCSECGAALVNNHAATSARNRRVYFITLLFIPAILIAGAIGYYKYFLPQGIAAVVNGEEIRMSELDAAARPYASAEAAGSRFRYQLLNQIITERLILQEAVKAGMTVSDHEVAAALADARAVSGKDEAAFIKDIERQYGDIATFQELLRRRILMSKFVSAKIIPAGADPQTAQSAFARWIQDVSGRAVIRVALEEQGSGGGSGCACCNKKEGAATPAGGAADRREPSVKTAAQTAQEAAVAFWKAKHGTDAVIAQSNDYGCHIQVDILQDQKKIGSLRYQNGAITEL